MPPDKVGKIEKPVITLIRCRPDEYFRSTCTLPVAEAASTVFGFIEFRDSTSRIEMNHHNCAPYVCTFEA